jgi:hypothetical protein
MNTAVKLLTRAIAPLSDRSVVLIIAIIKNYVPIMNNILINVTLKAEPGPHS